MISHRLGVYLTASLIKGAIVATVAVLLDVQTWRAIVIAIISASVTGAFAVLVAHMQDRRTREVQEQLDDMRSQMRDIAGATGADKRATDTK